MGAKFRLSPGIGSLLSKRLEDRNRDKQKKDNEESLTKEKEKNSRIGPPIRKEGASKRVAFIEPEPVQSKTKEPAQRSKGLPYVDVPPLKPTLRTSKSDKVADQSTKNSPAYRSRAPVEIGLDIEKLVETVMDLEINIPLRNLAGVSNAIQKEIKKQVTKTRLAAEAGQEVNLLVEESERALVRVETLPTATHTVMTEISDEIPEGYLIASDPVVQFLMENRDAEPRDLVVAKPSEKLRAIYAIINRVGQEECLLDSGSMIVSMAKETAVQLGLTWDPSIQINMESASNHVEKTLGLAKNVCFAVGGIKLYLQVHILENPPYRVLLGRPFESLANSSTKAKSDGTSEMTLVDPNTKKTVTVPTYERGAGPEELQKQKLQFF
jgi:hypothetical protein